jgi:tRNA1(Val) A37 N6-methylase TrmN6
MFAQIDTSRREKTLQLNQANRSELGQFFTPYRIARFMASLFSDSEQSCVRVLDPGAGVGSLTVAFLERFASLRGRKIEALAYELDKEVSDALKSNLADYTLFLAEAGVSFVPEVVQDDFIEGGTISFLLNRHKPVDFAILNPPYRKINSDSSHRLLLRKVGIETVNLYAGFVALAIHLLKPGGELVAIIPRSFCNGLYFRPFREFLLEKTTVQQIHLFDSRTKAFQEDGVLQENIILHLVKGGTQGAIKISTSSDDSFQDYRENLLPFDRIVPVADPERFIHIPVNDSGHRLTVSEKFTYSLSELGIVVSTGPVVDFRVKDFLRSDPEPGAAPLLYPGHFDAKTILWPKLNFRKANALMITPETRKQMFPAGHYTLVRRFSSKEEKRRIVARIVTPENLPGELVGFENHLNVFHQKKKGLPAELALGLAVYLNSTIVDDHFRQFSGHTQVNATDLRLLKYPSCSVLTELGLWAADLPDFDQKTIDIKILSLL